MYEEAVFTLNIQSKNSRMTGYVCLKVCIGGYITHDLCGQLTVLVCFSSKFVNLFVCRSVVCTNLAVLISIVHAALILIRLSYTTYIYVCIIICIVYSLFAGYPCGVLVCVCY